MSYDLLLSAPKAGEAAAELDGAAVVDPVCAERNERVATALLAVNPEFEVFRPDPETIAERLLISVEAARSLGRQIELACLDGSCPIYFTLCGETCTINISYGVGHAQAHAMMLKAWGYVRVVQRETGWAVIDGQLDREIDLERDFEAVLASYFRGAAWSARVMRKLTRPWWKFWG